LATAPFIVRFVAGRQAFQVRDELLPVGHAVGSDLPGDAWPQYLLGSSGTYLQEGLERLPIHPGPSQVAKIGDDLV
jgi:hypothetical protein